jgi:hypothetical protein
MESVRYGNEPCTRFVDKCTTGKKSKLEKGASPHPQPQVLEEPLRETCWLMGMRPPRMCTALTAGCEWRESFAMGVSLC